MKKPMFTRVCAFLAIGAGVVFAANAEVKWTYESNVLTGIAADGETAGVFALTDAGELSVTTAGTQKVLDFRSAAMPEGVPVIKKMNSLVRCSSMVELYLPSTVETLVDQFCNGVATLTNVVFAADSVLKHIPKEAFKKCTALTSIELPASIETMGASVFSGSPTRRIVFNSWIDWSVMTDNPFSGLSVQEFRGWFEVPGNNAKWVRDVVDTSKVSPYLKAFGNWVYTSDLKPLGVAQPAAVTLRTGGIGSIFIVTNTVGMAGALVTVNDFNEAFGSVTVTPKPQNADGTYTLGSEVTVKFEPADGVTFVKWLGVCDGMDATSAEMKFTVSQSVTLVPMFESSFLVYDEEAGELTDGSWVQAASGERTEITVGTIKRVNFVTGVRSDNGRYPKYDFAMDWSLPIKDGGAIMKIDTPSGTDGIKLYAKSFTLPMTLKKMGNDIFQCVTAPILNLDALANVTSMGKAIFADTSTYPTGNLRLGFATDENGAVVKTTYGTDLFTRGGYYMGPTVEFGPGITYLNANTFQGTTFASKYEGPIDVWFGSNLASTADGAMGTSIGGTNAVSFHFQGDMFAGTYKMFKSTTAAKSGYRYRFYIGAEGCPKWQAFITNTTYVTRWKDLEADIQAEYKKHFKGEPYGLTTAAAALSDGSGLPEAVWVFSLKSTGMCIRIQ